MPKTLLYIHGIRDDDPDQKWREALDRSFTSVPTETLAQRGYQVVAPSYLDLLESSEPVWPAREVAETYVRRGEREYDHAATGYFVALSALERHLGTLASAKPAALGRLPAEAAIKPAVRLMKRFEQAERYVSEPARRQAILERVLNDVPPDGDLIIVGHSLGSVITGDLLYFLPPESRIRLVVTLGSPLSRERLRKHLLRVRTRFPFERIGPWINIVGDSDLVTGGRGISPHFPEVLDLIVSTGRSQKSAHSAMTYLDREIVPRALEWVDARHDPTGELSVVSSVIPDEVLPAVVRAQYLTRLVQRLKPGEQRNRFATGRQKLALMTASRLRELGHDHQLLDRLLFGNETAIEGACDRVNDLALLVLCRLSNPLEPFVIEVPDDVRRSALEELALDLGVPQRVGAARDRVRSRSPGGPR